MRPFKNIAVKAVFDGYPPNIRKQVLKLREAIFQVAASIDGVGEIEETLRWGEPAYVTARSKSGSTIRIAWKPAQPEQCAMYFICTTHLVETFRTLFPRDFLYEGNRAIVFKDGEPGPSDALAFCIGAALTYQLDRKAKLRATGRRRGVLKPQR